MTAGGTSNRKTDDLEQIFTAEELRQYRNMEGRENDLDAALYFLRKDMRAMRRNARRRKRKPLSFS